LPVGDEGDLYDDITPEVKINKSRTQIRYDGLVMPFKKGVIQDLPGQGFFSYVKGNKIKVYLRSDHNRRTDKYRWKFRFCVSEIYIRTNPSAIRQIMLHHTKRSGAVYEYMGEERVSLICPLKFVPFQLAHSMPEYVRSMIPLLIPDYEHPPDYGYSEYPCEDEDSLLEDEEFEVLGDSEQKD